MKSITYPNGYIGTYDDDIEVGDLVVAYHKGYHIITSIEERLNCVPSFYYTKMYNDDGTRSKKLKNCCDGSFVRRAEDHIHNELEKAKDQIKALEEILKSVNTTNNQI